MYTYTFIVYVYCPPWWLPIIYSGWCCQHKAVGRKVCTAGSTSEFCHHSLHRKKCVWIRCLLTKKTVPYSKNTAWRQCWCAHKDHSRLASTRQGHRWNHLAFRLLTVWLLSCMPKLMSCTLALWTVCPMWFAYNLIHGNLVYDNIHHSMNIIITALHPTVCQEAICHTFAPYPYLADNILSSHIFTSWMSCAWCT